MMNKLFATLALVCVALSARSEEVPSEVSLSVEAAMDILDERAQNMGTREVRFVEKRIFPFRSKAATVEGKVRLSDSLGVSIEYPDKDAVLVIDDEGLIMRRLKDNGRVRERKVALEDAAFAGLMASVMKFDREELDEAFNISVGGTPTDWVLKLIPRGEYSGKVVGASIHADAEKVNEVRIDLEGSREIVIEIIEETPVEGFGPDEIETYFRGEKGG